MITNGRGHDFVYSLEWLFVDLSLIINNYSKRINKPFVINRYQLFAVANHSNHVRILVTVIQYQSLTYPLCALVTHNPFLNRLINPYHPLSCHRYQATLLSRLRRPLAKRLGGHGAQCRRRPVVSQWLAMYRLYGIF